MATVARSRLRAMLAQASGFYYSSTTTGNGAADGTTLVDTTIPRYDTSPMPNRWVYITGAGGTNDASGQSRRISSVSSSTVTLVTGFSVRVDTAVTYIILPFDPLEGHAAIEEALRLVNRWSPLSLVNETLVVDNLIANWDFESYAGSDFTSWTRIGTAAATQATNRLIHGANSAQITGADGDGIEQNIIAAAGGGRQIDQMVGKTLHVRGWTYASAASLARLRVTFDGTTYTNGPYHGGDGEWEGPSLQKIDVTIPADLTEMTVSFEKSLAGTMFCDVVVAWIDSITRYTLPTSFVNDGRLKVSMQAHEDEPRGDYRPFSKGNIAEPGRILRLEGQGRLTVPTTDSGTTELDEAAAELVVALAGRILHRTLKNVGFGLSERNLQSELDWKDEVRELAGAMGLNKPQEFITKNRHQPWNMKDESGTNYLYLTDR